MDSITALTADIQPAAGRVVVTHATDRGAGHTDARLPTRAAFFDTLQACEHLGVLLETGRLLVMVSASPLLQGGARHVVQRDGRVLAGCGAVGGCPRAYTMVVVGEHGALDAVGSR